MDSDNAYIRAKMEMTEFRIIENMIQESEHTMKNNIEKKIDHIQALVRFMFAMMVISFIVGFIEGITKGN